MHKVVSSFTEKTDNRLNYRQHVFTENTFRIATNLSKLYAPNVLTNSTYWMGILSKDLRQNVSMGPQLCASGTAESQSRMNIVAFVKRFAASVLSSVKRVQVE